MQNMRIETDFFVIIADPDGRGFSVRLHNTLNQHHTIKR
jgi:hypothetical protein